MSLTFIDTNKLPKKTSAGEGEVVEVLNAALCGAQNVHGSLRWLKSTETFKADATDKHQLIYLMDGKGSIRLNDHDYEVGKGGSWPFRNGDHPGSRCHTKAVSSRRAEDSKVKEAQRLFCNCAV
jgi:hypothetical protein